MTLTPAQIITAFIGLILIGTAIGRFLRKDKSGSQGGVPKPAQALEKIMQQVFILSLLIYISIFITDWFFTRDKDILNDTIVGVLIGAPIGWYGATLAYYTTETEKHK